MGVQERRAFVLDVLQESGMALRSVDLYRACKLRGATFEHRSVKNYLSHWIGEGAVLKVSSEALDAGCIEQIDTGEQGHFIAASVAAELAAE